MGFTWLEGLILTHLATVRRQRGEFDSALTCCRDALPLILDHDDRRLAARVLECMARLAEEQGQPERAECLMAATAALRGAILLAPDARIPLNVESLSSGHASRWKTLVSDAAGFTNA
jgi:hypothetical protein